GPLTASLVPCSTGTSTAFDAQLRLPQHKGEELRLASTHHVLLVLVSVQQLLLSTTHVHGDEREREAGCVWKVRSRPPQRRRDCKDCAAPVGALAPATTQLRELGDTLEPESAGTLL
ncbi:unnamed protein product, partial [Pylaiella littoralis]